MRPVLLRSLPALLLVAACAPIPMQDRIPGLVREGMAPGVSDADIYQGEDGCWYYRGADGAVRLARDANGSQVCTETG